MDFWTISECILRFLTVNLHSEIIRVAHSPLNSEVSGSNSEPYVGKLVVAYNRQFTVQNLDQLYVLVSSVHKTTLPDMTCTVLKAT